MTASRYAPDTLPAAPSWHDEARCASPEFTKHEDLWFARTSDHDAINAAKKVCRGCPVILECGQYALAERIGHGVWGGMTTAQRKGILRRQGRGKGRQPKAEPKQPRKPAECGTRGGYRRHRKNGEEACDACKRANTDADNRLRRTGTTKAAA